MFLLYISYGRIDNHMSKQDETCQFEFDTTMRMALPMKPDDCELLVSYEAHECCK